MRASATRWFARLALGLLLVLVLGSGLASICIDAEEIARATSDRISARLGCHVSFEGVEARWLPGLAVRLREVRLHPVAGERPFLSADRALLRLSLLGLLRGRDALRSLELRDGVAEIGPYRFEGVRLRGEARLDRGMAFEFAAELPGTGSLRDGRFTLSQGRDGAVAWSAESFVEVDLGELEALRALDVSSEGLGQGTLALAGTDRKLESAELVMELQGLDLRGEAGLGLRGSADLEARLGGSWRLDLGAAEISLGGSLRKPAGVHARATGPVSEPRPRSAGDWEVRIDALQIGRSRLQGEARMRSGRPSAELSGEVDLAELAAWSGWAAVLGGRLQLERLAYAPPLPLEGVGRAEHARIEYGERPWQLSLSGPVSVLGPELATPRAAVDFLGESFQVAGSYDTVAGLWELDVASRSGVELANLAEAVETGPVRSGRAYGRVSLRGGLQLATLAGRGELEVFDGTASHLSLRRVSPEGIGPGAGPHAFERLIGLFEVRDRRIEFTELLFEQDGEIARVGGSVSLADGAVDLAGGVEYVIGEEATVTPIQLSGTLDRLHASVEDPPEIRAEQRKVELRMLEAMLIQVREKPVPDDPELARALREHVRRIEERLRQIEDSEALESSSVVRPRRVAGAG